MNEPGPPPSSSSSLPPPPEDGSSRQSRMRRAWLAANRSLKLSFQASSGGGGTAATAAGSEEEQPDVPQAGPSSRLQQLKNVLEARKLRREYAREILKQCGIQEKEDLSFETFCKFAAAKERELWHLFQKLDHDQDGAISQSDFKAALKRAGYDQHHLPPGTLAQFMATLDTNKDQVITFDEFRSFLLLLPKPTSLLHVLEYYTVHQTTNPRPPLTVNQDADADLEVLKSSRKPPNASTSQQIQEQQHEPALSSSSEASTSQEPIRDENDVTDGGIFDNAGRYLLAGGIAGAVSRSATAPFDRLKVFLITHTPKETHKRKTGSLVKAFWAIYGENGRPRIRNFWVGNGLSVAKIMPESAIKFGAYETAKRTFARYVDHVDTTDDISASSRFLAGGIGGLTAQTAIYPVETIKTRTMSSTKSQLHGSALIFDTAKSMWLEGGIRYFYRGLTWGLCGVFPYAAFDMSLYHLEKSTYLQLTNQETPGVFASLSFGACSGGLSATMVYPLNLLRTRLQAQGTSAHPYRYDGLQDVFRQTYRLEGLRGFYKGLTPTLMKVVPSMSISWALFELTCRKLFEH